MVVVDEGLISQTLQRVANKVAYGGHVEVTVHDTVTSDVVKPGSDDILIIRAVWSFEWPGLRNTGPVNGQTPEDRRRRQQMKWSVRISNAMVDQEQGWIEKDDAQPPGASSVRALEKYNLKYEDQWDERREEGGRSGSFKAKRWGCDE